MRALDAVALKHYRIAICSKMFSIAKSFTLQHSPKRHGVRVAEKRGHVITWERAGKGDMEFSLDHAGFICTAQRSFLLIYRSISTQSKEYVIVLECINAVGMAVQVIANIPESGSDLKNKATADLAKQLLSLYASSPPRAGNEKDREA